MHLYRAPGLEPGCFHARWQKQRKMGWIFLQLRFTGLHTDGVEPHFQPSRKAVCCKGGNTNTKKSQQSVRNPYKSLALRLASGT
ncbi:MAG: hypothetical protein [Bacteriophage sp.]|jgi:hypothetical protein|nr:MAG: hypothetical protein [Bacteriophage sp.]UVY10663.1 MAG: hypothetical protein [Bacteriophage sp.]UWG67700.1 MAG: hypothetical protein [Bacteriophage sp.]